MFAADRLGIHRLQTVTGGKLEVVRRVILTQAWGVAAIALILTFAQVSLNRSLIIVFLLLSTLMLLIAKGLQSPWLERRRGQSRALLIGDAGDEMAREFERLRGRRLERWSGTDAAALEARFRAGSIDEVVITGQPSREQMLAYVGACAEAGLPIFLPLPLEPQMFPLPPPEVETVVNSDYVVYQPRKLEARVVAAKAVVDRVLAAVLLILFAPIMLLVALAVRIGIGSPLLFIQRRGGIYGDAFPLLKFRTMRVGADRERAALGDLNEMDGPVFKMREDPRVTRLGRILRRTSLDELPQLFNVLAGDMSLVGPRPEQVELVRRYKPEHLFRLMVKPGLTGPMQVFGRGRSRFEERLAVEREYIENLSLSRDLRILALTIPSVFDGRGAY